MYHGQFHYYTGPKSYYPNKVIDACPPPISQVLHLETAMEKLSLEDKQQLREFATTFGKSVRQQTVRDKSKEDTGHLPYQISFCTQQWEPGSTVTTASLLGELNPEENNGPHNQQTHLQYEVLFYAQEVLAVKHARRREQFSFFLVVLLRLTCKETNRNGIGLCRRHGWPSLARQQQLWRLRDDKNSPYAIVDRVNIDITMDASGAKLYNLPQTEVDRIERTLQGGCDTYVESDNESSSDDENSDGLPERTPYSTRTGQSATRLSLY